MNALTKGFYTSREAADLIEVGDLGRIRKWLDGYPGSSTGPLLERDFHAAKRAPQELSFFDLIEVRFVEFFRAHGVKMQTLRDALRSARKTFGAHPFATNKVRFLVSEDKKIYVEESADPIATKDQDPKLWNLVRRQYEIVQALHGIIENSLVFDANTELAKIWRPRLSEHPSILIDPMRAYGKPIVESGIPTSTIYDTWNAESQNYGFVQEWFDISPAEVKAAIKFEQELRSRSKASAA